jgi:hypothetical protein
MAQILPKIAPASIIGFNMLTINENSIYEKLSIKNYNNMQVWTRA